MFGAGYAVPTLIYIKENPQRDKKPFASACDAHPAVSSAAGKQQNSVYDDAYSFLGSRPLTRPAARLSLHPLLLSQQFL